MSAPIELDLDALEAAALAASPGPEHIYTHPRDSNNCKANEWYHHNLYPQYVLELIRRLRAAEALVDARVKEISADAAVIGMIGDFKPEQIEECRAFHDAIRAQVNPRALVVCLQPDFDIQALDEAAMRAAGWVREPEAKLVDEFRAEQWWVKELESAVSGGTVDQRRAVAVVHNLLRQIDLLGLNP